MIINSFEIGKTVSIFEQLMKEKENAIILEFSLFESFITKRTPSEVSLINLIILLLVSITNLFWEISLRKKFLVL